MRFFVLKVSQYNGGEGYDGFWLVLSDSLDNAKEKLLKNKTVNWLKSLGGLEMEESSLEEASEKFGWCCLDELVELAGDNYN